MRLRLALNAAGDVRVTCLRDRKDARKISGGESPPLVCSSVFQELHRAKEQPYTTGFGSISSRNRFTRHARMLVRSAGAILDRYRKDSTVFLTGTLPGSSEDALRALSAWSGWVVQTVTQWVRDTIPGACYFGVWEYQKRGALHIHLCVATECTRDAQELISRWKKRWISVLDGVQQRSGVDVYSRGNGGTWADSKEVTRTDAQRVEKNVGAYLSKYLSKGSDKTRSQCCFPPSGWIFLSRNVRTKIEEARTVREVEKLDLACCLDLFERIGGLVVAEGVSVFPYNSPVDNCVKGLVALFTPIHGSMVFNTITSVLRCLDANIGYSSHSRNIYIPEVACFFSGRVVPDVSPPERLDAYHRRC